MINDPPSRPRTIEHTIQYDDGTLIAPLSRPCRISAGETQARWRVLTESLDSTDNDPPEDEPLSTWDPKEADGDMEPRTNPFDRVIEEESNDD